MASNKTFMLRIDPDIYRRAKAKATLEKMTLKELFEMLLQKYLAEETK